MKKFFLAWLGTMAITMFVNVAPAAAEVTLLPDPTTVVYDDYGNPIGLVASEHDDFFSYSADLLTQLDYEGFDGSVGTGGLDLLIYTGANGQSNASVAGGPFPDPLAVPAGSPEFYSGTWGQSGTYTPIKVSSILDYLHSFDPSVNIPVFNFDMNQTGANPDVFMNGQVKIVDTTDNSVAAFWAFDNLKNNVYDPSSMVLAMGNIDLGVDQCVNPNNGHEQTCYALDNNKGSGSLDFIAYAPTMDLSAYADSKYVFIADFSIGNAAGGFGALNNGFEELYLTGAFAPANTVPEPASVLLFATGLMGLAGLRRKK